jgi:hypothetical protein
MVAWRLRSRPRRWRCLFTKGINIQAGLFENAFQRAPSHFIVHRHYDSATSMYQLKVTAFLRNLGEPKPPQY